MQASLKYNASLLEVIPDIVIVLSRDGRFLDCVGAQEQMYVPKEFFVGKHITEIMPEEVAAEALNKINQALLTGEMQKMEYEVQINETMEYHELRMVEWYGDNVICMHLEIGYRILGATPRMLDISSVVLSHHERWDGKGYPKGLKMQEIPLHSRIIAIADTYDAMTSERSYRHALPPEVALREIEKNAGTQFDPELALFFIAHAVEEQDDE